MIQSEGCRPELAGDLGAFVAPRANICPAEVGATFPTYSLDRGAPITKPPCNRPVFPAFRRPANDTYRRASNEDD